MTWGTFSPTHIVSLLAAVSIIVALYFSVFKLSARWQTIILGILSFSGISAIIYNLVAWNSPLEYLPLHLCSINALLLPIVVFTRNKTLGNLLLFWSLGALFALVLNNSMAEAKIFSLPFCFYYFPHVLEFGIPILLFKLGLVKKDYKCIISTLGITLGIFIAVHFVNVALNAFMIENNITNYAGEVIQVNYMFTVSHDNLPLLTTFYSIIPYSFWYLLLVLPIIAVYLVILYIPQIIQRKKQKSEKQPQ